MGLGHSHSRHDPHSYSNNNNGGYAAAGPGSNRDSGMGSILNGGSRSRRSDGSRDSRDSLVELAITKEEMELRFSRLVVSFGIILLHTRIIPISITSCTYVVANISGDL